MAVFKVIGYKEDGKYMDDRARKDVIEYCLNREKIKHLCVGGYGVSSVWNAPEEMELTASIYNNNTRLRLRHMVLSFDPQELNNYMAVHNIARAVALFFADKYQIIYAVHEEKEYLHIHFVMNVVCYLDGHKYRGDKKDYYELLSHIKKVLKPYHLFVRTIK